MNYKVIASALSERFDPKSKHLFYNDAGEAFFKVSGTQSLFFTYDFDREYALREDIHVAYDIKPYPSPTGLKELVVNRDGEIWLEAFYERILPAQSLKEVEQRFESSLDQDQLFDRRYMAKLEEKLKSMGYEIELHIGGITVGDIWPLDPDFEDPEDKAKEEARIRQENKEKKLEEMRSEAMKINIPLKFVDKGLLTEFWKYDRPVKEFWKKIVSSKDPISWVGDWVELPTPQVRAIMKEYLIEHAGWVQTKDKAYKDKGGFLHKKKRWIPPNA